MSIIKECIESRWTGGHIVEIDFSQIEVRLLAEITGCHNLKLDLEKYDMHCMAASFGSKHTYDELLKGYNKGEKWAKDARFMGKRKRFLVQYGGGATALRRITGCTLKEARDFIKEYYLRYPEIKEWQDDQAAAYAKVGKPSSFGVGRVSDGPKSIFGLHYRLAQEYSDYSCSYTYRSTKIANRPVQGSAAMMMHTALALLLELPDVKGSTSCTPINTVYDSIIFDIGPRISLLEFAKDVNELLTKGMVSYCDEIYGVKLELDYPIDIEVGETWNDMKELKY